MRIFKVLGYISAGIVLQMLVACGGGLPQTERQNKAEEQAEIAIEKKGANKGVIPAKQDHPVKPIPKPKPESADIITGKVYYINNGDGDQSYLPLFPSTVDEVISSARNNAPQVMSNLIRIGLVKVVPTWSRVEVQDVNFDGTCKVLLLDGVSASANGYVLKSWLVSPEQKARMDRAQEELNLEREKSIRARMEQAQREEKLAKERAELQRKERQEAERIAAVNAMIEPRLINDKPLPIIAAKSPTLYKQYMAHIGSGEKAKATKMIENAEVFLFTSPTKLIVNSTIGGYSYAKPYDGPYSSTVMVFVEKDVKKLVSK